MNAKERACRAELKRIEMRIKEVESILNEVPHAAIIECRKKAFKVMEEHKGDLKKIAKLIKPLADEEGRLFAVAKKQTETKAWDLWDESRKLKVDKSELIKQIYLIEQKHEGLR